MYCPQYVIKVLAASEARSHAHVNTFIQKLPEDVSANYSNLEAQVRAECNDTTQRVACVYLCLS